MFLLFPSCPSFSSCSFPLKFFLPRLLSFSPLPLSSSFYLSVSFLPSASSPPLFFAFSSFPFSSFYLFSFVPPPYPPILLSPPSPAFLFPLFTSHLFPFPFPLPSLSFLFTSPPTVKLVELQYEKIVTWSAF